MQLASNCATHGLAKSLQGLRMSLKRKEVLLFLAVVCILQQCAMLATAWPYFAQIEEEEGNKIAIYDQNMFEGDINITTDELVRFYGGPKMDEPGNATVSLRTEL